MSHLWESVKTWCLRRESRGANQQLKLHSLFKAHSWTGKDLTNTWITRIDLGEAWARMESLLTLKLWSHAKWLNSSIARVDMWWVEKRLSVRMILQSGCRTCQRPQWLQSKGTWSFKSSAMLTWTCQSQTSEGLLRQQPQGTVLTTDLRTWTRHSKTGVRSAIRRHHKSSYTTWWTASPLSAETLRNMLQTLSLEE